MPRAEFEYLGNEWRSLCISDDPKGCQCSISTAFRSYVKLSKFAKPKWSNSRRQNNRRYATATFIEFQETRSFPVAFTRKPRWQNGRDSSGLIQFVKPTITSDVPSLSPFQDGFGFV